VQRRRPGSRNSWKKNIPRWHALTSSCPFSVFPPLFTFDPPHSFWWHLLSISSYHLLILIRPLVFRRSLLQTLLPSDRTPQHGTAHSYDPIRTFGIRIFTRLCQRTEFNEPNLQKNLLKEKLEIKGLVGLQNQQQAWKPEGRRNILILQPWQPTTECRCIRLSLQYKEGLEMSTQLPSSQRKFLRPHS
jgi:hypothetical protein